MTIRLRGSNLRQPVLNGLFDPAQRAQVFGPNRAFNRPIVRLALGECLGGPKGLDANGERNQLAHCLFPSLLIIAGLAERLDRADLFDVARDQHICRLGGRVMGGFGRMQPDYIDQFPKPLDTLAFTGGVPFRARFGRIIVGLAGAWPLSESGPHDCRQSLL
jgi:hypothetical protein